MKVGNTKHAIVLSLFAFAAIAFFLMRLIPSGPRVATAAAGQSPSAASHGREIGGLPVEVVRDAFSHPALTRHYLDTLPDGKKTHTEPVQMKFPHLLGHLPPAVETILGDELEAAGPAGKPSDIAGKDRQLDGKPKVKIELKGIMRAKTPLALVTIDGHEDVTVGLGEYIDTTYRITQFSQNAVLLTSDDDKTWLYVGHEVTEK